MFKKIFLIIMVFFTLPAAFGAEYKYQEANVMCAKPPYSTGNAVAGFFSNATGTNYIMTKAAEIVIQNDLKKQMNSNFNVQIKSFGGKNFIDGKFKSIKVSSKQINSDTINAHDFTAKSVCGFNQIALKGNDIYFLENFLMEFSAKISNEDLKKTVLTPYYLKLIEKINLKIGNFTVFQVGNPTIDIKNDRIFMTVQLTTPTLVGTKVQTLHTDAGIAVENEKIIFTDINVKGAKNLNFDYVLPLINRLNPFVFRAKIDNLNVATIRIKSVQIKNNTIHSSGLVIIPKTAIN